LLALNTDNIEQQPNPVEYNDAREVTDTKELQLFLEHPYHPIIERFTKLPGVEVKNSDMVEIAKVLNDKTFEEIDINTLNEGNIDKNLKNYLSNYLSKVQELNPKQENKE
jgi:F0F1-type ATP synthase beta subunit